MLRNVVRWSAGMRGQAGGRRARLSCCASLATEAEQAAIRAEAEALVAELLEQLEGQPATERALLEAAANKPVTRAVEAEVRRILGLDG